MSALITDIGFIVIIATLCAIIARVLKQPLLISYILAGVIIGPYGLKLVTSYSTINAASELGIAFLLFIVGLELNINKIKNMGAISIIAGISQVVFTFFAGYLFTQWVGFPASESIYISIALTLSSTVIVVKLYEDKEQIDTLHGRVALGILLVQDFLAIISMAMLSGGTDFSLPIILSALLKGLGFFIIALLLGQFILPVLFRFFAGSQELLFIASVGWCFLFGIVAEWLELSVAIGAFLAGVSLASLPYSFEIISKTRSLRDFFATIFFVALGMQIGFNGIGIYASTIFWLSLFVLVGNPLIVMILMSLFGFKSSTSFFTSIAIAQISEFSLVYVLFAYNLGLIPQFVVSIVAVIAVITFTLSSYMIINGEALYFRLQKFLRLFEHLSLRKLEFSYMPEKKQKYEVLILGCNRMGNALLNKAKQLGKTVLVIDNAPEKITQLMQEKVNCVYGDASDISLLSKINLNFSRIIISTVPELNTNLRLARAIRSVNKKVLLLFTADRHADAMALYKEGVDYVIMPHHIGGQYVSSLLENVLNDKRLLKRIKKEQLSEIGFETRQ